MKCSISFALMSLCLSGPVLAQDSAGAASADELAQTLANPIASLISVPIQQNFDFGYRDDGWRMTTNVQPVIPVSISERWNLISRTIVPIIHQDDITGPDSSETGLGDIVQSAFFSPKAPTAGGLIWGVGPVLGLPTAGDDLGTDRWLVGPTAVALKQQGPWTIGVLANHLWDVGGSSNAEVSATFLQPFVAWNGLGKGQTITFNLESTRDWESEQWTVPLNLNYSKIVSVGSQLINVGGGARAYLDSPRGGPDWGLRLTVTLLFPK